MPGSTSRGYPYPLGPEQALGSADIQGLAEAVDADAAGIEASVAGAVPSGAIIAFGGSAAPVGWHLCDGTAHGSSALQAVIGSANAPDLRDRFVIAAGSTYAAGATGGTATHVHNMPDHRHSQSFPLASSTNGAGGIAPYAPHNTAVFGVSPTYTEYPNYGGLTVTAIGSPAGGYPYMTSGRDAGAAQNTDSTNSVPPYYAVTYIIKL